MSQSRTGDALLSAFTPSLMSHRMLEAIFVQRHWLADRLVENVRESATTRGKHHALLVGPRGIGKTHLVSLVYHRVKADAELAARVRVAWLREEERGATSFLLLLRRILQVLAEEYGDTSLRQEANALSQNPGTAEVRAEHLLLEFLGDRTLLLIMENLNDLFKRLGEQGQRSFRAFLQNHGNCVVLATTPLLFDGISKHTAPFYGFFNIDHLSELTVEEATEFLGKIAQERGDTELENFLHTSIAEDRIRAVAELAGGHPRIWILFAGFLTRDTLDELVPLFIKMLDDLTPYYQSRLDFLEGQQAQIVEYLCLIRHAVPVKDIAQECFLESRTASVQLGELTKKGYVRSEKVGREAYYELREPLMRLCLEVKDSRGKPLQLIVDFLRRWFSRRERKQLLEATPPHFQIQRQYLTTALILVAPTLLPADHSQAQEHNQEMHRHIHAKNWDQAIEAAEECLEKRSAEVTANDWFWYGYCLVELGRHEEALVALDKSIEINPDNDTSWNNRGYSLIELGRHEEALIAYDKSIEINPDNNTSWNNRGQGLNELGRYKEALVALDKSIEINPDNAITWSNRGYSLGKLGRHEEALVALDKSIEINPENPYAYFCQVQALFAIHNWEEGMQRLEQGFARRQGSIDQWSGDTELFCRLLLKNTAAIEQWVKWVTTLVRLYENSTALGSLGEGLTASISGLFEPTVTDYTAQQWNTVWQEAGAGKDDLQIPLRLLDAAVRWREERSPRVLLGLPVEERRVLESLLPKEDTAS